MFFCFVLVFSFHPFCACIRPKELVASCWLAIKEEKEPVAGDSTEEAVNCVLTLWYEFTSLHFLWIYVINGRQPEVVWIKNHRTPNQAWQTMRTPVKLGRLKWSLRPMNLRVYTGSRRWTIGGWHEVERNISKAGKLGGILVDEDSPSGRTETDVVKWPI